MHKSDPLSLISDLLEEGFRFEEIEAFIATLSPNLASNCRFLDIAVSTPEVLLAFYGERGNYCVSKDEAGIISFFAIARSDNLRPVSRVYRTTTSVEGLTNAIRAGISPIFIESATQFEVLAETAGAAGRIEHYKHLHSTKESRTVESFANGRHANTNVRETHFFDSGDRCLLCDEKRRALMTTTLGSSASSMSVMFFLCEKHKEEGSKKFLIDYLAEKLDFQSPFIIREIDRCTDPKLVEWAKAALESLGCTKIRLNEQRRTLTGIRVETGFTVIIRLYRVGKNDYAYMILNPEGKNVRRIDEAQDHPEQPIRWDHRHLGLPQGDNKLVEPSYTFGMPTFDKLAIEREIAIAEEAYFRRP